MRGVITGVGAGVGTGVAAGVGCGVGAGVGVGVSSRGVASLPITASVLRRFFQESKAVPKVKAK